MVMLGGEEQKINIAASDCRQFKNTYFGNRFQRLAENINRY